MLDLPSLFSSLCTFATELTGLPTDAMPFDSVPLFPRPGLSAWDVAKAELYMRFSREEEAEAFAASNRVYVSCYGNKYFVSNCVFNLDTNEYFIVGSNFVVGWDGGLWRARPAHLMTQSRAPTPQLRPLEPVGTHSSRFSTRASGVYNGRRPVQQLAPRTPAPRYTSSFYAVANGRVPGVYGSWEEAELQVKNFPSAKFKRFATEEEALLYLENHRRSQRVNPSDPDPRDPSTLVAFCDGSSKRNGLRGCRAGWACVFPHNPAWNRGGALPGDRQTSNRAEYYAAIKAIKRANREDPACVRPLYIFTDSMLLVQTMTEWVSEWRASGWVKDNGNPVRNADLLERLVEKQGQRRILWQHVKAHTNSRDWQSKWNDRADRMAKEEAD